MPLSYSIATGIGLGFIAYVVLKAFAGGLREINAAVGVIAAFLLKLIFAELKARGSARSSTRAWLGLNCVEIAGMVHVVRLTPDGPAEAAGLRRGDVIVALDGTPVTDLATFYRALWRDERAERDVVLEIRRGDATERTTVHTIDRMSTLSRPRGV